MEHDETDRPTYITAVSHIESSARDEELTNKTTTIVKTADKEQY